MDILRAIVEEVQYAANNVLDRKVDVFTIIYDYSTWLTVK